MTSKAFHTCAGLTGIKGRKYLKCSICCQTYDLLCGNVTERQFSSNTKMFDDWKCAACKSKQPKSDNTNTPVRESKCTNQPDGATSESDHSLLKNIDSNRLTQTQTTTVTAINKSSLESGSKVTFNDSVVLAIEERIMAAVRQELPSLLASIIKAELEPVQKDMQCIKELQDSVLEICRSQKEVQKSLDELKKENNRLSAENHDLHSTVSNLHDRLNNIEQHLRDNNLELHGIPEHRSENILNVLQQCGKVVNYELKKEDVINCTRVAKQNKESKLPRTIIVEFRNAANRDSFYSAVHRYNKSHPTDKLNTSLLGYGGDKVPVYISEHLSPHNKVLHAEARKRAKAARYQFVWVRGGRIYARKDPTSQYILIKNINSLELIK